MNDQGGSFKASGDRNQVGALEGSGIVLGERNLACAVAYLEDRPGGRKLVEQRDHVRPLLADIPWFLLALRKVEQVALYPGDSDACGGCSYPLSERPHRVTCGPAASK